MYQQHDNTSLVEAIIPSKQFKQASQQLKQASQQFKQAIVQKNNNSSKQFKQLTLVIQRYCICAHQSSLHRSGSPWMM
jgi:Tfp pilus assembly protein PilN